MITCSRCKCDLSDYSLVGYDGPKDRSITSCNPFSEWETLCKRCEQPEPKKNDSTPVWHLVLKDMERRNEEGIKRYGVPLQANNGRDMLMDAYEEALDLCAYLRGAIRERDGY